MHGRAHAVEAAPLRPNRAGFGHAGERGCAGGQPVGPPSLVQRAGPVQPQPQAPPRRQEQPLAQPQLQLQRWLVFAEQQEPDGAAGLGVFVQVMGFSLVGWMGPDPLGTAP